jgi:hypothetical protein
LQVADVIVSAAEIAVSSRILLAKSLNRFVDITFLYTGTSPTLSVVTLGLMLWFIRP